MLKKSVMKRKVSTDLGYQSLCCKKLSVFACVCAVFSLLVHSYNYVDNTFLNDNLDLKVRLLKHLVHDEIEERLDAYYSSLREMDHPRRRRDALLVRFYNICI